VVALEAIERTPQDRDGAQRVVGVVPADRTAQQVTEVPVAGSHAERLPASRAAQPRRVGEPV
jgi:hypothetical protein